MSHTWRNLAAILMAALLVFGVAACGGDDDDTAVGADDSEETTDTTEGDEGDSGAPEVNPCAEGVSPEDAGLPPSEDPAEGATEITVTAKEYEFDGVDALEAGGTFAITFENAGEELHELVIQKIDDSETRTIDEMMASEEQPDTLTEVAFGFACPGSSSVFGADVSEPGRYVALCFIPTGTTPETGPADFESGGAPHAMNGMVFEFNIS